MGVWLKFAADNLIVRQRELRFMGLQTPSQTVAPFAVQEHKFVEAGLKKERCA